MAFVLRPIEQLQLDNSHIWMLDWFGGLVDNPLDLKNPSIECILTPCTIDADRPSGLKRHIGRQVATTIGCSAINAIGTGRQYLGGQFSQIVLTSGSPEETITFNFSVRRAGSVKETFLDRVGIHDYFALINQNLFKAGIESPVKIVDGFLTSTNNSRSYDRKASADRPSPFRVMFHELEIIRFYYTNSQRLVRAVFNDEFQDDNLTRCVINTNHGVPHYDHEENKHRFEYRLGFYREDAQIIGRILFDQTGTAMRGVRRVFQSMLASKLNEHSIRRTAYPRTFFPYLDKVELVLTGKRLRLENGSNIFAVHRIESCDAAFPYKNLSVQCEVEPGGEIKAPAGSPAAFSGRPPKVDGPGQKDGDLDTEGPPLAGSVFADCIPETRRFLGLANTRFLVEKYRPNTHTTSEHPLNKLDIRLKNSSPGNQTNRFSEATNQKIVDVVEGGDPPVDLDTFLAILSGLRVKYPTWKISTIPAVPDAWRNPLTNVFYCGFPSVACAEKKKVLRQFSFLDKDKKSDDR